MRASIGQLFEVVLGDLRAACRGLRRRPAFAVTVVLTLALGIGGTTGIFAEVNAVMFRPLPGVVEPERLVSVTRIQSTGVFDNIDVPDYLDLRSRTRAFSALSAHCMTLLTVRIGDGEAQRATADLVDGNFFAMLGIRPALGRVLDERDERDAGAPAVVLGYAFWRRAFGADSTVVGRSLSVNGSSFRIVGVAPRGFDGARAGVSADLWIPLSAQRTAIPRLPAGIMEDRAVGWILVVGRLRDGVTTDAVRAELNAIAAQLARAYPITNGGRSLNVVGGVGLYPDERESVSGVLRLLLSAVTLVLLVGCANVASLLLVQLATRHREMATRVALGASRQRLILQSFIDGAVIAIPGGALGLLLANAIARLSTAGQPPASLLRGFDVTIDGRVFVFAIGVSVLSSLLVAMIPAFGTLNIAPMSVIKSGGRGFAERGNRARHAIVMGQVVLSVVALATAAMFLRGLSTVLLEPIGFDPRATAMVSLDLTNLGYSAERLGVFQEDALRQLRAIPNVSAASIATTVPPSEFIGTGSLFHPGEQPAADLLRGHDLELGMRVTIDKVAPGYFGTLGIRLEAGRDFIPADRAGAHGVAVINQELARRLWPRGQAVGMRISWPSARGPVREPLEVVGVTADSKVRSLTEPVPPMLYVPLAQSLEGRVTFIVRSVNPSQALQDAARVLSRLAPAIPQYDAQTMSERVAGSAWQQRMAAQWVVVFGLTALALCTLGMYGVVAQSVSNRTRELAVRLALGATERDVTGLIVRHGMRVAATGLVVGAVVFFGLRRVIAGLVAGVGDLGVLDLSAVLVMLTIIMLLACYLPARRVLGLSTAESLRQE